MNPFKPHIVKFDENVYAIRRLGLVGWEYRDIISSYTYWWERSSEYFDDCIGDKSKVYAVYNKRHKKGERL